MVMSLSRVLWKVHSKAPTVTASMLGTVLAAGEGYTTIRDSTRLISGINDRSRRARADAGRVFAAR
mgnify:CR=1 FL=1